MKNKKGFTLIELLAVIVILAIIMVIAVPKILDLIDDSRANAAQSSIKLLKDAIKTQVASSQTLGNNTFTATSEGCYVFDFDDDENNNVASLTVKNKEYFTGKITYCNNRFTDDNLSFNSNNNSSNQSKLLVYDDGLADYFDSKKFDETENTWSNSISNGNTMTITGTITKMDDGSVNVDATTGNYATFPIDNTKNIVVIYSIQKVIRYTDGDNRRVYEIPTLSSVGYKTPTLTNGTSGNYGFGMYYNDNRNLGVLDYEDFKVTALKINLSDGIITINVNGEKEASLSGLGGMGNTIYLSHCASAGGSGYGNNLFKMIAVVYDNQSDEQIQENITFLKNKYNIE